MPLEDCPTCGYALSIVDHQCRHCASAPASGWLSLFDPKGLSRWIVAAVVLMALGYLIFFR
ncbi:MAG: hypothetical protein ABIR71_06100 [Chthoniobacterales bacterium]